MDFIIDFYKNLDTVNLFIFWGVIIVVLLLLIFAIIIANKNKKLEKIIESNGIDINEYDDKDIPTLKNDNVVIEKEIIPDVIVSSEKSNANELSDKELFFKNNDDNQIDKVIIKENDDQNIESFVAEEHVIDYEKEKIEKSEKIINDKKTPIDNAYQKEIIIPTQPYQKNVLKEMSLNQTSPIGIIKKDIDSNKELEKAEELYNSFDEKNNIELNTNNIEKTINNNVNRINHININVNKETNYKKGNYLEELSKKSAGLREELKRTDYELKQEEDAIISYEELMRKKDNIKMIDEEEAVISINELFEKNNQKEKLYNLNNESDNEKFINELKDFRSDL